MRPDTFHILGSLSASIFGPCRQELCLVGAGVLTATSSAELVMGFLREIDQFTIGVLQQLQTTGCTQRDLSLLTI